MKKRFKKKVIKQGLEKNVPVTITGTFFGAWGSHWHGVFRASVWNFDKFGNVSFHSMSRSIRLGCSPFSSTSLNIRDVKEIKITD